MIAVLVTNDFRKSLESNTSGCSNRGLSHADIKAGNLHSLIEGIQV